MRLIDLSDDDIETIRIHMNAIKERLCNQRRYYEAGQYQHIVDILNDAVPVILCRDCKHWYCYGDETFCSELGIYDTNKESYCSYAKREEK